MRGLLDLYEASQESSWLEWALRLQDTQDRLFWDSRGGGYFCSEAEMGSGLPLRLKDGQWGMWCLAGFMRHSTVSQGWGTSKVAKAMPLGIMSPLHVNQEAPDKPLHDRCCWGTSGRSHVLFLALWVEFYSPPPHMAIRKLCGTGD